jgi:selenocysteine lyase/cysteine desulfurase
MTLKELHSNETMRRREFPVAGESIFLANAAVCPFPQRVADAMSAYSYDGTRGDQEQRIPEGLMDDTRRFSAELLDCGNNEIALIGPTSVSLSLIANGLAFEPGDNVVFYQGDYPSNAVVWINLQKRGVELRSVEPTEAGAINIDSLRPLVDAQTRLVALSSAHFVSGYRLDIDTIGAWLKESDILFAVDGIQTVGVLPTPVENVDFLAADSHKWLLGPCAAGIFYVSEAAQEALEPTLLGWNNVLCPDFITRDTIGFKSGARKYEAGSDNYVGLTGLRASLTLLRECGAENVADTVLGHTRRIREAVCRKGYQLASSDDERISGITSFRRENLDMGEVHRDLAEAGITASLRSSADGQSWVRFSPHYYNTQAEIDTALEML